MDAVAKMIYRRNINGELLSQLVRKIYHSRAQRRLPAGIPRDRQFALHIEAASSLIISRFETMKMIDKIDDSTFQWARFTYHTTLPRYLRVQSGLAQSREWGHLFNEPAMVDIISFACRDLVDILGTARLIKAPIETVLHPEMWSTHKLSLNEYGEVVTPSGLIFPK